MTASTNGADSGKSESNGKKTCLRGPGAPIEGYPMAKDYTTFHVNAQAQRKDGKDNFLLTLP